MSLSDLASLGSFVSGVAVLVSLVFLFFQMRQMTEQVKQAERNQRALMNQGVISRACDTFKLLVEPEINVLMMRAEHGETDFTGAEIRTLAFIQRLSLISAQDAITQHRSGLLDEVNLEGQRRGLGTVLSLPVFRALWLQNRDSYTRDVAKFVDDMIAGQPLINPRDRLAGYKACLASVMRAQEAPPSP